MDGYLTGPFIQKLPDNLKASWLPGKSSFSDFYKSVSRGYLQVAVSDEYYFQFIIDLKKKEPELAKSLISLESSGKLRAVHVNFSISEKLKISGIRTSTKKHISGGLNIPSDMIFHDTFEQVHLREKISNSTNKPLFLEVDLTDGTIEYLFRERSFNLNIGDTFNWARFIRAYALPFKRVRILDPHLFKNVTNVDLSRLLSSLVKKSEKVLIEIISNGDEKQIEKIRAELNSINDFKADVRLYNQLSDVSETFHKRLIWTDYWVLLAERGFDFIKQRKGLGEVKKETNLYLTGKYASKDSIWYQVEKNWQDYLGKSELISS